MYMFHLTTLKFPYSLHFHLLHTYPLLTISSFILPSPYLFHLTSSPTSSILPPPLSPSYLLPYLHLTSSPISILPPPLSPSYLLPYLHLTSSPISILPPPLSPSYLLPYLLHTTSHPLTPLFVISVMYRTCLFYESICLNAS